MVDYEIFQGDQETYTITIKSGGTAIDLNGGKLYFTIKTATDVTDANATLQVIDTISVSEFAHTITLLSADTADIPISSPVVKYVYDIRWINASGVPKVLISGNFKVKQPITRATS